MIHERFGSITNFVFSWPLIRLLRKSRLVRRVFDLEEVGCQPRPRATVVTTGGSLRGMAPLAASTGHDEDARRTNQINGTSHVRAFAATATIGEATAAASEAAETWLITRHGR